MKINLLVIFLFLLSFSKAQTITYKNCLYQNISKQNDDVIDESKVDVKIIWKSLTGSVYDIQDIEYKGVSIRFQTPTNQFNVEEYSSFFTQGIDNHGGFPYITIMKRKSDNQLLFKIEYPYKDKIKIFVDINEKKSSNNISSQNIQKERTITTPASTNTSTKYCTNYVYKAHLANTLDEYKYLFSDKTYSDATKRSINLSDGASIYVLNENTGLDPFYFVCYNGVNGYISKHLLIRD